MGSTKFEYVKETGWLGGRTIGKILPNHSNQEYTGLMSKKYNREVPMVAVDGFDIEIKSSERTKRMTHVDLHFLDKRGDTAEAIFSTRLTDEQIVELETKISEAVRQIKHQAGGF